MSKKMYVHSITDGTFLCAWASYFQYEIDNILLVTFFLKQYITHNFTVYIEL